MHMRVKILQIIRPDTISRYYSHSTEIVIDKVNIGSFTMIHFNIVIRDGKIARKHGPYFWCFFLDFKYLGWSYRENIKTAKNDGFCEGLLSENDFETISATSYCYKYVANASEAVLAFSIFTTMMPTLLRQFRRSLQIKNIITKIPCVWQIAE